MMQTTTGFAGWPLLALSALFLSLGCDGKSNGSSRGKGGASGAGGQETTGDVIGSGGATSIVTGTGGTTVALSGMGGSVVTGGGGAVVAGGSVATGGTAMAGGTAGKGGSVLTGGTTLGGTGAAGAVTGGTTAGGQKTGGTGAAGAGSGGQSGTGTSVSPSCPNTGGPSMVKLPAGFCIDSTEVTRAQYAAWVATNPTTTEQITDCGWNTTFVPDAKCMGSPNDPHYVCLEDCDSHPQVCVDWCDAYAYCQAVGKRLCGKIGGGHNNVEDFANPDRSQWHNACTSQGANLYPYGTTYNSSACNGADLWPMTSPPYQYKSVPVGSMPTCQSSTPGYTGVFDLSGSVSEWDDACTTTEGAAGLCRIRGGSFSSVSNRLRCDASDEMSRGKVDAMIGFRCCSSL